MRCQPVKINQTKPRVSPRQTVSSPTRILMVPKPTMPSKRNPKSNPPGRACRPRRASSWHPNRQCHPKETPRVIPSGRPCRPRRPFASAAMRIMGGRIPWGFPLNNEKQGKGLVRGCVGTTRSTMIAAGCRIDFCNIKSVQTQFKSSISLFRCHFHGVFN